MQLSWLERVVWDHEVAGSSPVIPTYRDTGKTAQMHLRCRVRQNAPEEAHDESVVQTREQPVTTYSGCKHYMALVLLYFLLILFLVRCARERRQERPRQEVFTKGILFLQNVGWHCQTSGDILNKRSFCGYSTTAVRRPSKPKMSVRFRLPAQI